MLAKMPQESVLAPSTLWALRVTETPSSSWTPRMTELPLSNDGSLGRVNNNNIDISYYYTTIY